jgi:type II secretion system protein C
VQRAAPLIAFIITTALAVLLAFGLNTGIGLAVAPPDSVGDSEATLSGDLAPGATPAVTRTPQGKSERDYLDTILKRNIFDTEAITAYDPIAVTRGDSEAITDLNVILKGTMVATPKIYSSALIADDGKDAHAVGYGIGDKLRDAEIIKIEKGVVTLKRGDGRIETLTMIEGKAPTTSSSSSSSSDGEGEVEKLAENKYAIDRALLDKYIGDIESISRMGRALLHRGPDGDFDGYRLSAIRRNTLADQLGIKNGDVVHSVNGQALNSVQGAMSAYQGMMSDSSFTFEITRRGQRVTMEYEVR